MRRGEGLTIQNSMLRVVRVVNDDISMGGGITPHGVPSRKVSGRPIVMTTSAAW